MLLRFPWWMNNKHIQRGNIVLKSDHFGGWCGQRVVVLAYTWHPVFQYTVRHAADTDVTGTWPRRRTSVNTLQVSRCLRANQPSAGYRVTVTVGRRTVVQLPVETEVYLHLSQHNARPVLMSDLVHNDYQTLINIAQEAFEKTGQQTTYISRFPSQTAGNHSTELTSPTVDTHWIASTGFRVILQRAAKLALQALYVLRQIRPSVCLSVTLRQRLLTPTIDGRSTPTPDTVKQNSPCLGRTWRNDLTLWLCMMWIL